MKRALRYAVTLVYKPLLSRYLSSTRAYAYKGIRLIIPPEVFHPGFFFSTKILLQYLSKQTLLNKSFLEIGAGSGLIALYAAKEGAIVTATDINPIAIDYLKKNQTGNDLKMTIIHSDLFNDLPLETFDIVAINPPYFKRTATSPAEHAWYCGENGEYFERLFKGLGAYLHAGSQVFVILSEMCDMEMIQSFAGKYGWSLNCIVTKKNLIEKLFIFKMEPWENRQIQNSNIN